MRDGVGAGGGGLMELIRTEDVLPHWEACVLAQTASKSSFTAECQEQGSQHASKGNLVEGLKVA